MNWLKDVLSASVQGLLVELVLAIVALAAAYAIRYLRLAAERLQQGSRIEQVATLIERTEHLVETTVLALEGTVARSLRQAVADGTVTRDELEKLGQQAVEEVMAHLDEQGRQLLEATVGDLRAYIRSLVEAKIEALKAQGVISRASTVAVAPK